MYTRLNKSFSLSNDIYNKKVIFSRIDEKDFVFERIEDCFDIGSKERNN
jgi:hypothetical protein